VLITLYNACWLDIRTWAPLTWGVRTRVDFAVGNRNSRPWSPAVGLGCSPGGEPDVIWQLVPRVWRFGRLARGELSFALDRAAVIVGAPLVGVMWLPGFAGQAVPGE
jgi:hypothetical protein